MAQARPLPALVCRDPTRQVREDLQHARVVSGVHGGRPLDAQGAGDESARVAHHLVRRHHL
eukprot:8687485-Lingulodinium_polyedra.AAC.1